MANPEFELSLRSDDRQLRRTGGGLHRETLLVKELQGLRVRKDGEAREWSRQGVTS